MLTGKAAALLAPFALLLLPPFVETLRVMVRAERSVTLRDGVFDARLEGKLQALVTASTVVIVGGDSRAERAVDPAIVEARTGSMTVNVATTAQDLITLSNAIVRHGLPPGARQLIVSTSVFQVNDGAIDAGYLSTACLLNMTTRERAAVYADRLGSPWSPLAFSFAESAPAPLSPDVARARGFVGVVKQLSLPLPRVLLNAHPWYRNLSLHGARWRIFQAALARLASLSFDVRIVLFQPPISPAWRAYTAGTFVDSAEREFATMLRDLAAHYPNVQFVDFYSEPDPRLGNEMFYDIQHLNRTGAAIFSDMLVARIGG